MRNIRTRMTNGNENENRFLGELSYCLNRSIICDFKRRIYHKLQYRFFDTSHISLFHKAFSFFYLLDFFRSTFCPVALLISFIKYFLGSGYIKIRLLYCENFEKSKYCIFNSFCFCDGPWKIWCLRKLQLCLSMRCEMQWRYILFGDEKKQLNPFWAAFF